MSIQDIRERLSWLIDNDSVDAIESHRSQADRGSGHSTAQTKGWDLNVIGDLMQGNLRPTRSPLRDTDRVLKAAHHAACVEDLAGEASKVLNGAKWRSRQD